MVESGVGRGWVPITLDNAWFVEFLTEPAGVLRVGPAKVRAEFRFTAVDRDEQGEAVRILGCQLRLADSEGGMWQGESVFPARVVLDELIDLTRPEPARWLSHAPKEWREVFKGQLLVRGACQLLDDRFYRWFYADNTAFTIQYKYQAPSYDIAHLGGGRLLVRVCGLFGNWDPLRIEGPGGAPVRYTATSPDPDQDDPEGPEGFGDYDNLEPLVYPMDVRRLLFRNTAARSPDGYWEDNGLAAPVVFRRVEGAGQRQPAVTFSPPGAEGPEGEPAEADKGEYESVDLEVRKPLSFLARPGGVLHVAPGPVRLAFRLGIHPDSPRERFDVLSCRLRLADDRGEAWEARNLFTPEVFVRCLCDLSRVSHAVYEADGEEGFDRLPLCLLKGVRDVLDDGVYRHFLVGTSAALSVRFKDQRPTFDVARVDENLFLVQVSGLVGTWHALRYDEEGRHLAAEPGPQEEGGKEQPLAPLVYELACHHLLFRNTSFAVDDGFWHQNDIPIPLVFRRAGGEAAPQEGVRFVPDR